jgi:sigma-B regulation protein RsbU (phosphoserine phosphatase)
MKKIQKIRLQPKLMLGLVIMAAVLSMILAPAISELYRVQMEEYYSNLAFNQASIAADYIDGDSIAKYYQDGVKDDYYEEVCQYLLNVKQNMDLKYFYVVVPEEEQMVYIWDAGVDGEEGVCDLGDADEYYGGGYELMHAAFAVDAKRTILITDNDTYGYLASAYVPILDSTGTPVALASVDVSMEMINEQIHQFLLLTIGVTLAVLLLSILAYYFYIRRILIRPLGTLHHAAIELIESRMEHLDEFKVEVNTRDEIQELAHSFQYMVEEINKYIHNLGQVMAEKERIGTELNVAKHIQTSMLPCIFPPFPERHEIDIYATMTPAKEVGGDFYDFFLVDDDHLAMVMADVSGKGVPAALFMMISKTLLKSALQSGLTPKPALEKVNNQLCENNDAEMFVTVWVGILEMSTGKMKCANAGHEYPAIMRRGGEFELFKDKHGFVLAGMEGARYREYELEFGPGDRLFIYTDGVAEATDATNTLYGTDRMLAALNSKREGNCRQLLETLHKDIDDFVGEADQFDDITMLCIEMKEVAYDMKKTNIAPSLDKLEEATAFFEDTLSDAGASMKMIAQINIVVDEIFSNIARYSGATIATLGCKVSEDQVVLRFSDNGRPYNPTDKPDPDTTLSAEERDIGGLGIFMVKKTMDDVVYEYTDGLNILTLTKKM